MTLTPEGWQLLQQWEGCRLVAYPDPASGGDPWTIGYGHTGAEVTPGLVISQAQAEAWLAADAARAAASVDQLLEGVALSARQRDALVSFCFNVGAGAMESSTMRRRLRGGERAEQVIAEELPRWCKGPGGPVEGLIRRRAAEVEHARSAGADAAVPVAAAPVPQVPIQLLQAVAHFRDLPHQRRAWELLQESLSPEQRDAFALAYRQASPASEPENPRLQLAVPYLSQNDS
ncbi:MAG: lysozyme, partial [Synechococcus sp.]